MYRGVRILSCLLFQFGHLEGARPGSSYWLRGDGLITVLAAGPVVAAPPSALLTSGLRACHGPISAPAATVFVVTLYKHPIAGANIGRQRNADTLYHKIEKRGHSLA